MTMAESTDKDFFLITASDGDVRIHQLTEADAISYLDQDEETGELTRPPYRWDEKFDTDPLYWNGRCLIIRGAVVSAQPVAVKYELR